MSGRSAQAADYAAYVALRLVIMTIQALPMSLCQRGASVLARLFGRTLGFRERLVDENLQLALPNATPQERRRIAFAMWEHLFLMVAEIAHTSRKVHRSSWRQHCRVRQIESIVGTLMRDEPTVILAGHYSNFELGAYVMGVLGFPTNTVARTLDNRYVNEFINEFRGRTGQRILPKQGSRDAVSEVLDQGRTLALLGDQAAGQKGCWVNFFGKPASTHKAIALFTLGYKAPTMVLTTRRIGGPMRFEVELDALTDPTKSDFEHGTVPALLQWYTRALEKSILKAPEQYWWVHRRWKGQPPRKQSSARNSQAA